MATKERRPRIDAGLAELIDKRRGNEPFESYVRGLLHEAVYPHYTVEKDPAKPRRFRVMADPDAAGGTVEERTMASGLTRVDAEIYATTLTTILRAMSAVMHVVEEELSDVEEIGDQTTDLYNELRIIGNRLYDIEGHKLGDALVLPTEGRVAG